MATSPRRPCAQSGCGKLVSSGRCEAHAKTRQQAVERSRESSTQRGYNYKWQQARKAFLRLHPLCECDECRAGALRLRIATVVDHVVPHKGDETLFWDLNNWQAMAKQCHDKKTATEDGGWGRGV